MTALFLYAQILGWMFLANAVVYAGLFFINAELLPSIFSNIYESTTYIARVVICLFTFLTVGNILFTKGFQWFDVSLAVPFNIIGFILVQIVIAVIVSKSWPSLMIIPATLAVCASVYWVYTIIN